MVLFFITTLLISIVGIGILLGVKQWEMSTGSVVWKRTRRRTGRYFHITLLWIEKIFPLLFRTYSRLALQGTRVFVHKTIAKGVLAVEHGLERVLQFLRHKTEHRRSTGEASVFLREVAAHKKKLLRGTQNTDKKE